MAFTSNEANAAKLSKILLNYGLKAIRDQLEPAIKEIGYTNTEQFFNSNFAEIKRKSDLPYFKIIFTKLVDKNGIKQNPATFDVFDLTACVSIFRNILLDKKFNLKLGSKTINAKSLATNRDRFKNKFESSEKDKACEKLKDLRNEYYAHLALFEIEKYLFDRIILEIQDHIKCLYDYKHCIELDEIETILKSELSKHEIDESRKECLRMIIERDEFKYYLDSISNKLEKIPKEILNEIANFKLDNDTKIENMIELIYKLKHDCSLNMKTFEKIENYARTIDEKGKQLLETINKLEIQSREKMDELKEKIKSSEDILDLKLISFNDIKKFLCDDCSAVYIKILVLNKNNSSFTNEDEIERLTLSLGSITWNIIIDLDPKCENEKVGFQKRLSENIQNRTNMNVLLRLAQDLNDDANMSLLDIDNILNKNSFCYIIMNGSYERNPNLEKLNKQDELRTYNQLTQFFKKLFTNVNTKQIACFNCCLGYHIERSSLEFANYINFTISDALSEISSNSTFKLASNYHITNFIIARLDENESDESKTIKLLVDELLKLQRDVKGFDKKNIYFYLEQLEQVAIKLVEINSNSTVEKNYRTLPKHGGGYYKLTEDKLSVYKDVIEIVDVNEGEVKYDPDYPNEFDEEIKAFLNGNKITYSLIYLNENGKMTYAYRTKLKKALDRINSEAEITLLSNADDFTIYHEPSSGGTTLGKIILFKNRTKLPCVEIKRLNDIPKLYEALSHIHLETKLPVLVLSDNLVTNKMINNETYNLDDLRKYTEFQTQMINNTVRMILVKIERVQISSAQFEENNNNILIRAKVDKTEQSNFKKLFKEYADEEVIAACEDPKRNRSKLFENLDIVHTFSLYYFSDHSELVKNLVENHLKYCGQRMKELFFFISISRIYFNGVFPISLASLLLDKNPGWLNEIINGQPTPEFLDENNRNYYEHFPSLNEQCTIQFKKSNQGINLDSSSKNENTYKRLISCFFIYDREKEGLFPHHIAIAHNICDFIAKDGETDEKKSDEKRIRLIYTLFSKLVDLVNNLKLAELNEAMRDIGKKLFIKKEEKAKEKTDYYNNLKSDNQNAGEEKDDEEAKNGFDILETKEVEDMRSLQDEFDNDIDNVYEDYFSALIVDSKKVIGDMATKECIEEIYNKLDMRDVDFKPCLGSMIARFVFFEIENTEEGIQKMKKILNIENSLIKESIKVPKLNNLTSLYATYGNMIRHKLNYFIRKKGENPHERVFLKSNECFELVIESVKESLFAFKMSEKEFPINSFALSGQIMTRYQLLKYCFTHYLHRNHDKYKQFMSNRDTDKLIRESEDEIQRLKTKVRNLIEDSKTISIKEESKIFLIPAKMLTFRYSLRASTNETNLLQNISKYLHSYIDECETRHTEIYETMLSIYSNIDKKKKWTTLDEKELGVIKDLSKKQIDKLITGEPNHYRDYILASIYIQKYIIQSNQTTKQLEDLKNAHKVAKDWESYYGLDTNDEELYNSRSSRSTDHKKDSLANYFYGLISLVYALQPGLSKESKDQYLKIANDQLKTCFEMLRQSAYTKLKYKQVYNFYLNNENGLKALSHDTTNLKLFRGYLEHNRNLYYVMLSELDFTDGLYRRHFLTPIYNSHLSKNLPIEIKKKRGEICFNLLFRRDNIYFCNPRPFSQLEQEYSSKEEMTSLPFKTFKTYSIEIDAGESPNYCERLADVNNLFKEEDDCVIYNFFGDNSKMLVLFSKEYTIDSELMSKFVTNKVICRNVEINKKQLRIKDFLSMLDQNGIRDVIKNKVKGISCGDPVIYPNGEWLINCDKELGNSMKYM